MCECNNTEERLSSFVMKNNLVIGTIFKHKDLLQTTWNSPDGHAKNQIDHVVINKTWGESLIGVVARLGADVASDPSLVLAKICLKHFKAKRKDQRPRPINVQRQKYDAVPKLIYTFTFKECMYECVFFFIKKDAKRAICFFM